MWLIPSRRRIAKLRNFCDSAVRAETTTPAMIIVDSKDYIENLDQYDQIKSHHFSKPRVEFLYL
jgi:hypothetical protein